MKITQRDYQELKTDIKTICKKAGIEKHTRTDITPMAFMFNLFSAASDHRGYDDSHPMYKYIGRFLPYTGKDWINRLYDAGLQDNHIFTALKNIGKELELIN